MFADDIEERTKIELKEHIIYNSRAIYDLNPSAATDTKIIETMSVDELLAYDRKVENTYYDCCKKKK